MSWDLSVEAFSGKTTAPETLPDPCADGQSMFVVTDAGREDRPVIAKARDRHYEAWFGGRPVACAGIASVVVTMEHRGGGLLSGLFDTMLRAARDRGAVISLLYPSASGIYRRFGYEVIGTYDVVTVPTAALAQVRTDGETTVRRAVEADMPAVRGLYSAWAATVNASLTREGPNFPTTDAPLVTEFTGITIAEEAGRPVGYAMWDRVDHYHPGGKVVVEDIVALTPGAARSLLAALGTHAMVAPETQIPTSGLDVLQMVLPSAGWTVTDREVFMLSLLDVPGAMAARGWPEGISETLEFEVTGLFPDGDGRYRLDVSDGAARCERLGDIDISRAVRMAGRPGIPGRPGDLGISGDLEAQEPSAGGVPRFTAGGLAARYACALTTTQLRQAGLLAGPEHDDAAWDRVFGNNPVAMRDSF